MLPVHLGGEGGARREWLGGNGRDEARKEAYGRFFLLLLLLFSSESLSGEMVFWCLSTRK